MYTKQYSDVSSFNWKAYLDRYQDLRKAGIKTKEAAYRHWNVHGKKEGRNGSENFDSLPWFDWKSYVERYHDLRLNEITTKEAAERHWREYGKYEKRNIGYSKICIFHCGNIDIFNEILLNHPQLNNMPLIITYYNDDYPDILWSKNLKIIHLMRVKNKGADCGPFLLCIDFLLKHPEYYNDDTFFFKIHTKSIVDWRETLITDMFDVSKDITTNKPKPILFGSSKYIMNANKGVNYTYIKGIIKRNIELELDEVSENYVDEYYEKYLDTNVITNNKYTSLLPSFDFYKRYEPDLYYLTDLTHWYKYGVNEFHRISNVNYINKFARYKSWFMAGTIFGFNKCYLNTFNKYNIEAEYSILEEGYCKNNNATKLHSWEYYFGLICLLNKGVFIGHDKQVFGHQIRNSSRMKYSIINQPFSRARIAMFMILPGEEPNSGGYRTLLKYISLMNRSGYTVDIYFGICWNDKDVHENVHKLDNNGMPYCSNWLNPNEHRVIHTFVRNIEKYEEINIKDNNYYLGFKCQRSNYEVLIANAWQTAEAAYCNKHCAKRMLYIIQDREELFYENADLQKYVLKTYKPKFEYYCITKYLANYFRDTYQLPNVYESTMSVNTEIYFDKQKSRQNSVVIPYYQNVKPGRMPVLVRKIIMILANSGIKCYVYPYDFETKHPNIVNLGTQTESQLNNLYNKHKVGIVFSNTNPSRLGFEMYCSGLHVIEHDCEFTRYDLPNEYFTKIKSELNIVGVVRGLFDKQYDGAFRASMSNENDNKHLLYSLNT